MIKSKIDQIRLVREILLATYLVLKCAKVVVGILSGVGFFYLSVYASKKLAT